MKLFLALSVIYLLAGCSGLSTAWVLQLHMQYLTPQAEQPAPAPTKGASGPAA